MATQVFVNLPTADLDRSKSFFEGIGWPVQPNFTDENAACILVDENIYLMVLTPTFYATFTDKTIVDPTTHLQVQTALSRDSREDVDAIMAKVLASGGSEPRPAQDFGFMYSRDFEDPDGNLFSALWMDPKAAEQGPEAFMAGQQQEESGLGHA